MTTPTAPSFPRYFIQRDSAWVEASPAGFAAAEHEVGLSLHGVVSPVTAGFTALSHLTGTTMRGRLVYDIYGIVGSRELLHPGDMIRAQEIIEARLAYGTHGPRPDAIVTGGAAGVDMLAEDIADALGIVTIIHRPARKVWKGPGGFEERNRKIVADATRLLCIRCTLSTTYGSGWTADLAEQELGTDCVERVNI
jgi:hypothetical protein